MTDSSYVLGRGYLDSTRLYAQHWLWRYHLGYLLHPTIPQHQENLKVADVACGTGVWLIETARTLPASTQLDGYDVSPDQYPPKQWLPKNVHLDVLNMLDPVPEELMGKYDIVHVGLIVVVVRSENPGLVLNNLMTLLKPGGYLQWDESDLNSMAVTAAGAMGPHPGLDDYMSAWQSWLLARGLTWKWAASIDKLFLRHGLEVISYQRLSIADEMKQPWTDIGITAAGETIKNIIVPSCKEGQEPSAERWVQMFEAFASETRQNQLCQPVDMVVTVGRKPLW